MRKTMIIPTYWCRRTGELWQEGDAVYDHPTPVDQEGTLERTLLSMKQFHEKDFKLVILICPTTPEVEEEAYGQVLRITRRAQLNAETYLFTAGDLREMTDILHTTGLTDQGAKLLSMFGYSNVRNICLLAASILTADAALLIDDDEVFELPDFVPRSLEFLGRRVYGDIVHGVAGYYLNSKGQYYDTDSRLKTAQIKLERLQNLLANADNMADIITIESAISETEYEIESLSGTLRRYDALVGYATIYMTLSETYKLSENSAAPLTFGQRVSRALSDGLRDAGVFFEELIIGLAGMWVFVLVAAVLVVLLIRAVRKRVLRKKKKDEPSSPENPNHDQPQK